MKNFKSIAVALDLSDLDEKLIRYAKHFSDEAGSAQLYFIHIIPTFVLPENVKDLVHSITSPGYRLDEMVREKITTQIEELISKRAKVKVLVQEGHPFKSVIELTKQIKPDLLLVGKKKVSESSGIVAKMLARQAECAVSFVTENAKLVFSNLLVPFDFSPFSVRALWQAKDILADRPGAKINVLHVLDYPPTTQYLARNYGLLASDWEQRLDTAFQECLIKNEIEPDGIHFTSIKNHHFNIAEHIHEFATEAGSGLIVLGAKGHTAFDDLFLGSVAEKLVSIEDDIPVLIVR